MRIDEPKSTWAIISAKHPYYNAHQNDECIESLKEKLMHDSYHGYILDSIYNDNYIKQDSLLILNTKSEDDFRFDIIRYLNSAQPYLESAIVKYKSEPVAYKLLYTGYESAHGKLSWGVSNLGSSFLINQQPFKFEAVDNYKMDYIDYKKALLYT